MNEPRPRANESNPKDRMIKKNLKELKQSMLKGFGLVFNLNKRVVGNVSCYKRCNEKFNVSMSQPLTCAKINLKNIILKIKKIKKRIIIM